MAPRRRGYARAALELREGESAVLASVAVDEPEDDVVWLSRRSVVEQVHESLHPRVVRIIAQQISLTHAVVPSVVACSGSRDLAFGGFNQCASTYQV